MKAMKMIRKGKPLMDKFEHADYYIRKDCRVCHATKFVTVLDLGSQPAANELLDAPTLNCPTYPLRLALCDNCHFLQLDAVVNPDVLFSDYLYLSSTAASFRKHFEDYAKYLYDADIFSKDDLVVDIGSNDGILLRPLEKLGAEVLGIDPAVKIAEQAAADGLPTIAGWFGAELAAEIVDDRKNNFNSHYHHARVITANNVFAHVDDLDDFLEGIDIMLADDGYFIIEMPYVGDMITKNTFDLIYHEHLSYFSIDSLERLLKRKGFRLDAAIRQDVHGGTYRYFVRKAKAPNNGLVNIEHKRAREGELHLGNIQTYIDFAARVADNKAEFAMTLADLKSHAKVIHGFGAPAKATTMLNYFGLPDNFIDVIYDDSEVKQGKFIPGTKIQIKKYDPKAKSDYMVIFAWNFAESIMERLNQLEYKGGFIIPVPKVKVYDRGDND